MARREGIPVDVPARYTPSCPCVQYHIRRLHSGQMGPRPDIIPGQNDHNSEHDYQSIPGSSAGTVSAVSNGQYAFNGTLSTQGSNDSISRGSVPLNGMRVSNGHSDDSKSLTYDVMEHLTLTATNQREAGFSCTRRILIGLIITLIFGLLVGLGTGVAVCSKIPCKGLFHGLVFTHNEGGPSPLPSSTSTTANPRTTPKTTTEMTNMTDEEEADDIGNTPNTTTPSETVSTQLSGNETSMSTVEDAKPTTTPTNPTNITIPSPPPTTPPSSTPPTTSSSESSTVDGKTTEEECLRKCHSCTSFSSRCPADGNLAGTDPGEVMNCPCGTACFSEIRPWSGVVRGCTKEFPLWDELSGANMTCQKINDSFLCFCLDDRCNTHDMTIYPQYEGF